MNIFRLLFAATGIQCVALGGGLIGAGALAALLPDVPASHLDQPNHFLPIWLTVTAFGAVLVRLALERRPARTVILGAAVLALVLGGAPVGAEYAARTVDQMRGGAVRADDFKVLQFNIFEGNPYPLMARQRIAAAAPDVATLLEPHPEVLAAPELLAALPYRTPCVGQVCLAAIWSKRPITAWRYDRLPIAGTRPLISLDVLWADTTDAAGRPVRILTTHYGWPWPPKYQRPQRAELVRYLRKFDKQGLVITGDFNATPWAVGLRRQDRRLAPLKRRTHALYTWPAYVPRIFKPTNLGVLPIDHVYAGPEWRTVRAERLERGASDHYPVMVTLRRQP